MRVPRMQHNASAEILQECRHQNQTATLRVLEITPRYVEERGATLCGKCTGDNTVLFMLSYCVI
jgi:hypothetical protein